MATAFADSTESNHENAHSERGTENIRIEGIHSDTHEDRDRNFLIVNRREQNLTA